MITTQTPAPMLETQLASKGYRIPKTDMIIYSRSTIVQMRPTQPVFLTLQPASIRRYLEYAVHHGGVHINHVVSRKWRNVIKLNLNADGNPNLKSYYRTNYDDPSSFFSSKPHSERFDLEYGMDLLRFIVKQMQDSFKTGFENLIVTQHLYARDPYDTLGDPLIFVKVKQFTPADIYVPYNHGYYRFKINTSETHNVFWNLANKSQVRIATSVLMPELLLNFCQVGNDMIVIVDPEIRLELCSSLPWVFLPRILRVVRGDHRYQFEDPCLYRLTHNPRKIAIFGCTILARKLSNREMHALNGNIRLLTFIFHIIFQVLWAATRKKLNKLAHSINGNPCKIVKKTNISKEKMNDTIHICNTLNVDDEIFEVIIGNQMFHASTYCSPLNVYWVQPKESLYPFLAHKHEQSTSFYGFCTTLPEKNFVDLVGSGFDARPQKFVSFIMAQWTKCTVRTPFGAFQGLAAYKDEPVNLTEDYLINGKVLPSKQGSINVLKLIDKTPCVVNSRKLDVKPENVEELFKFVHPNEEIKSPHKTIRPPTTCNSTTIDSPDALSTPDKVQRPFVPILDFSTLSPRTPTEPCPSKSTAQETPITTAPTSPKSPVISPPALHLSDFTFQERIIASDVHYLKTTYTSFIDKTAIGHKTSPLHQINEFVSTAQLTDFKKIQTQVDTIENMVCVNKEWMHSLTEIVKNTLGIGAAITAMGKISSKLPNTLRNWSLFSTAVATVAYVGYKTLIQQPKEFLRIHTFTPPKPVLGNFNVLTSQLGSDTIKSPCLFTTCHTFIFKYDLTPCDTITRREVIFSPMLLEEIKRSFNPHITVDNTSSRSGWFTVLSNLVRAWSSKMVFDAPVEAVFSGTVHVAVCQIADDLNMQQDFC